MQILSDEEGTEHAEADRDAVGRDDNEDSDVPVNQLFRGDSSNAEPLSTPAQASTVGGSSATATEQVAVTPVSAKRHPKKKPRTEAPSLESENATLMRMILQGQEDNKSLA